MPVLQIVIGILAGLLPGLLKNSPILGISALTLQMASLFHARLSLTRFADAMVVLPDPSDDFMDSSRSYKIHRERYYQF